MTTSRRSRAQNRELAEYAYTWCRLFGHEWSEWHSEHEPDFGYYEAVYCPRCTTERLFTISLLGDVIARRYVYPEGYRLAFKINAADLRRTMRKAGWWSGEARSEAARSSAKRRRRLAVAR